MTLMLSNQGFTGNFSRQVNFLPHKNADVALVGGRPFCFTFRITSFWG
jgi:hypothetical protein